MATILNTTQQYSAADVVTHTNLNNIIGGTTFVSGSGGATDDISLEVNSGGSLRIKDDGVTTPKILDANVTKAKLEDISAPLRLLGRTTAGAGVPEEVTVNDDDDLSSATDITLATDESIKAYIDKLKPNVSQFIKTDPFYLADGLSQFNDFGFEVSITPKFGNSNLRYTCSVASNSNNASHSNFYRLMKKVGTGTFQVVSDAVGPSAGNRQQVSFTANYGGQYNAASYGIDFIDTSSFTEGVEVTYKLQVFTVATVSIFINRAQTDVNDVFIPSPISICNVEEIYK
jgi:hypothetical protein